MVDVLKLLNGLALVLATASSLEEQKHALRNVLSMLTTNGVNSPEIDQRLAELLASLFAPEIDQKLTELLTALFATILGVGYVNMVAKPDSVAAQTLEVLVLLQNLTLEVDYTMELDPTNSNVVVVTFVTAETISMPSDDNIGDAIITPGVQQLHISGLSHTKQSVTSLKFNFSPAQNPSNTSSLISFHPSDEDISKSIFLVLMRLFSLLFRFGILEHTNLIPVARSGKHGFQPCEDEDRESRVNVGGISLNEEKFEEHWLKVIEFLSIHEDLIQGTLMNSVNDKDPNGLESKIRDGRTMSRA
jgi:hypothetical protein